VPAPEEPTAARVLVDRLVDAWGVRHIFGLPGDAITGLQAAIRDRPELTFGCAAIPPRQAHSQRSGTRR